MANDKYENYLMELLDDINQRYGSHTIKLAAEGYSKTWKMRSEMRSPCYTTRWDDLPIIRAESVTPKQPTTKHKI